LKRYRPDRSEVEEREEKKERRKRGRDKNVVH